MKLTGKNLKGICAPIFTLVRQKKEPFFLESHQDGMKTFLVSGRMEAVTVAELIEAVELFLGIKRLCVPGQLLQLPLFLSG